MIFGSVCSGIEAASVAWKPLGFEPAWFSEIEDFPSAVLQHHYPDVTNQGDMRDFNKWEEVERGSIDILIGGTPCQSFSVAGERKGLDDERGELMLTYLEMVNRFRPRWLVWENVPGVLSSGQGRDFEAFLRGLAKLGYGFAYRVLNAQYFGVPQRRRRVFVVGYFGDWRPPAAVLFERQSLQGDTKKGKRKGKAVTGSIRAGADECGAEGRLTPDVANTLTARMHKGANTTLDEGQTLLPETANTLTSTMGNSRDSDGDTHLVCFAQNQRSEVREMEVAGALCADPGATQQTYLLDAVCFAQNERDEVREMEVAGALAGKDEGKQTVFIKDLMQVRRLTPRECERLQGFPDDYTFISGLRSRKVENDFYQYIKKTYPDMSEDDARMMAADGPRYKALGNSIAVPPLRWIGNRLKLVEGVVNGC